MRQRIENKIKLDVDGFNMTTASNILVFLRQDDIFYEYTPKVIDGTTLTFVITYEEAMALKSDRKAQLQIAFTDSSGNKHASGVVNVTVDVLIKEAGYDGD